MRTMNPRIDGATLITIALATIILSCATGGKVPHDDSFESDARTRREEIAARLRADRAKWDGWARSDSLAPILKRATHADAFLLNGVATHGQRAGFEGYGVTRAVGPLTDVDRATIASLIADPASNVEDIRLGIMAPTLGLRFIAGSDTLAALLTFGDERSWAFRVGTRTFIGLFDPIATEMRAFARRLAPDVRF